MTRQTPIFLYRPPRNLKKVLALVLVVAMMASFAVGASAAFKDADKITYTTAVDVLTGLGVINGYADGTFRATDSVTRGAFAKMTAYVMNGGVNAAASYGTYAAASFKDVAANSTFGNAIGYCTNKGIISGYSNGTFRAGNKVTGVQAAKMLLGALGYDSKIEGYTGSAWAKNVLADAEDAGLFKGMGAVDLTQPLTREAAAQMIWNALQATMVKYAVGGVTITTPDGTTVNTGASAAEPVMTGNVAGFGTTKTTTLEMVEKYFPGLAAGTPSYNEFGRPVTNYVLTKNGVAKPIASVVDTPIATYTTAVAPAELYNKLGFAAKIKGATSATVTTSKAAGYIANGTVVTTDYTVSAVSTNAVIGGNGIVTEIYKTATANEFTVVQIKPTLVKVISTTNVKATTTEGAYTQYNLTGLTSGELKVYTSVVNAAHDQNTVTFTAAVNRGDYVLVYGVERNYTVSPATMVTGKVAGYTSSTGAYTIAGTAYPVSAAANAVGAVAVSGYTTTDATYAVDTYGNVIGSVTVTTPTNYIYVLATGATASYLNTTTNRIENVVEAPAVTVEGAVANIQVAKVGGADADGTNVVAGLYTYKLDANGKYLLKKVADDSDATGTYFTVDTINKTITLATGKFANAATKYFVAKQNPTTKAWSVTAYTGYTNVAITSPTAVAIDANKNNVAEIVFVNGGTETGASLGYTYVTGDYDTITNPGKWTYDVIVADKSDKLVQGAPLATPATGLYTVVGGTATKVTGTTALVLGASGADGVYNNTTFFTYSEGLLCTSATADGEQTVIAPIAANVPVYTYDKGAVTPTTAEALSGTNGSLVVIERNAAGTAIAAIYILA